MNKLDLRLMTDAHAPELAEVEHIYCEAFPQSERKPIGFLATAIERADYSLYAAFQDETLLGMALVYRSATNGFALLEYMAIRPENRGGGIGSRLFAAIAEAAPRPLLLEVESERPEEKDADIRRRRLEFYRKLACRTVAGLAYLMPKVASSKPPPMDLLIYGWPDQSIPRASLCSWLEDVYENIYGRGTNDHDLAVMLASIADPAPLI